jgi:Leu/Phe-tRNA-protein transferase
MTPHLRSLGAVDLPRRQYLERLDAAVRVGWPDQPASRLREMDRGLA